MTLAGRLRALRESLGLSAQKISRLVSISLRQWQDYEAGNNIPGGKVFDVLAHLGVNVNWLFTGEGDMFVKKYPAEIFKPGQTPGRTPVDIAKRSSPEAREIGSRIAKIADSVGGGGRLAEVVGVPDAIIGSYIEGKADVALWMIFKVADAGGVTAKWLFTGQGPIRKPEGLAGHRPLNQDLLTEIVEAIEELLTERRVALRAAKKAGLVAELYDRFAAEGKGMDRAVVLRLVKLAT